MAILGSKTEKLTLFSSPCGTLIVAYLIEKRPAHALWCPSRCQFRQQKEDHKQVAIYRDEQYAEWIEFGLRDPNIVETTAFLFPVWSYPRTELTPKAETPGQKQSRLLSLQSARQQSGLAPETGLARRIIDQEVQELENLRTTEDGKDHEWCETLVFRNGLDYLAVTILGAILVGQIGSAEEAWKRWIVCKLADGVEAWYDSGNLTATFAALVGLDWDEANHLRCCHAPVSAHGKGLTALEIAGGLRRGEL